MDFAEYACAQTRLMTHFHKRRGRSRLPQSSQAYLHPWLGAFKYGIVFIEFESQNGCRHFAVVIFPTAKCPP